MNLKKNKINIKKGDYVQIISGKNKGKTGIIKKVIGKVNSVIIENINKKIKHIKPKQTNEKGNIKEIEAPIHISNIKIIDTR
uniref:Large ribosomal subunit protein uL24c n=1 Tax=Kuetzingia canaliculata TaxID=228262 RepID=A0A1Z1MPA3_KUECA|nr:ribosomal protein L24 [Kuetzingia canaliculata]ARW67923.1 ribosomal protein L24 [Kuetzingia canaliculata]